MNLGWGPEIVHGSFVSSSDVLGVACLAAWVREGMSASSEALKFGCRVGEFSFPVCFPGLMAISFDRAIYLRVGYMRPHF